MTVRSYITKVLLVCSVLLLMLSIFCNAEGVRSLKSRAKNFYYGIGVKQDYSQALELYEQAGSKGDPEGKYIAGAMYFKGLGAKRDLQKSFRLLHQAAIGGRSSPESQKVLAQAYLQGVGAPKSFKKALQWYSMAAENDNSEAQNELGYMYFLGRGVKQDSQKGAELFLRAARNGLAIAQYNMGIMYYTGIGTEEEDLLRSYAWMNIAAANGHKPANAARGYLESVLSDNELNEAQNISDMLIEDLE